MMTRRYTFKLYPNAAQIAALENQCVLLARLWNAALEQRETQWSQVCQRFGKGERKGLSYYDQARQLKFIRADDPEYAAMSAASLELCLSALDLAFKAFFKRAKGGAGKAAGYPRYKRAADHGTIWHRDGAGWKMTGVGQKWKVYAKGIPGKIKARGKFPAAPIEHRTMEIIRRDGAWWLSVVVFMDERRQPGNMPLTVNFDLIDEFASVTTANGESIPGPTRANSRGMEGHVKSTPGSREMGGLLADEIQSARDRRFKMFSNRWRKEKRRIAKLKAREARQRREDLHRWTTDLVRQAAEMTVIAPAIKESTKSARGTEKHPGAAVEPVAALNRHVLGQAPALAIQMLEYKSAEAGIPFARITPDEHALTIGRELPAATKAARKASRILRKAA